MAEAFVFEKQILIFRPSNILIKNTIYIFFLQNFSVQNCRYSNKQTSSTMFSTHSRWVCVDACVALVSCNQISELVTLPVNVDLAVQQVAQSLCI